MCIRDRAKDVRYFKMPDNNIPSQKYRDTGVPRYFVMSSVVDNLCKNPCESSAVLISRNCVLMILYVNFLPLDVVVMLLVFILNFNVC